MELLNRAMLGVKDVATSFGGKVGVMLCLGGNLMCNHSDSPF